LLTFLRHTMITILTHQRHIITVNILCLRYSHSK